MRRILLLSLFVVLSWAVQAQTEYFIGTHGGVVAPAILNQNSWGAQEYEYSISAKMEYGIDLSVVHNDTYQLHTGFWLTTMGQAYTSDYEEHDWKREVWSDYFMVPVFIRKPISQGHIKWQVGAGMLWAIRRNAEQAWTKNGVSISQTEDFEEWHKPYWVSKTDVDDRYVNNDYMLYLDIGFRKFLSSHVYMDVMAYMALGLRDMNADAWKIENRLGKEYAASHNAFGGIKLCFGLKVAQKGRFSLVYK